MAQHPRLLPPLPPRPSRLSTVVRSVGRPALVGVAAGALAAVVLPVTQG